MKLHSVVSAIILLLSLPLSCIAQTQHWSEVPELVSSSMSTFRQLFRNAETSGFGITIFGDSQETSPGGAGFHYVPALGHEFFKHYGNIPKTGIITGQSQANSWLSAGASAGQIQSDTDYSLPSVSTRTYANTPSSFGLLAQFNTDGYTTPFLDVPDSGYFNGNQFEAELIVRTGPENGEASWRATLTDNDRPSFFLGDQIGSGVTNINANQSEVGFVSASLGQFDLDDHNALQIVARSADPDRTADIAGVRFINSEDSSGISVQTLSQGGYRSSTFLLQHGDAASQFRVLAGDDVIALQYGANDAAGGRPAQEFKDQLESIISTLRLWADNEDLPIILISDPDFENPTALTPERRAEFDLYPGVSAELATELDNVLALNTRLIGFENNWFVGSSEFDLFTIDGIHYSELGGLSLAQWQVESLLSLASVLGDVNRDGRVNFLDISPFIVLLSANDYQLEADINEDGLVNFLDISPFIVIFFNQ